MSKFVLLIVMLLLMSGFVIPDDPPEFIIPDDPYPYIDVFICDCMEPVGNTQLCYCTKAGTEIGNNCYYFEWTKYKDVESFWYMCDGWVVYIPMIIEMDMIKKFVDG